MQLRKKSSTDKGVSVYRPPGPGVDSFHDQFPCLDEFISRESFEDGSPRQGGTMSLSYSEGRYRGSLTDREAGEYVFLSGDTVTDLLLSLEAGLATDRLEWRRSQPRPGKRT